MKNNIRVERAILRMTQAQLAERIGVSRQTINAIEAAKYVQKHHRTELMNKANMNHYKTRMFHGFDTDTTMLRIGAMNLMLHGVDAPDVKDVLIDVVDVVVLEHAVDRALRAALRAVSESDRGARSVV